MEVFSFFIMVCDDKVSRYEASDARKNSYLCDWRLSLWHDDTLVAFWGGGDSKDSSPSFDSFLKMLLFFSMICVCWRSNLYVLCVFSFSEIECLFCTEYLSISPSSRRAATAAERSTTALLSFVNSRGWWQMAGRSPFRFCSLLEGIFAEKRECY